MNRLADLVGAVRLPTGAHRRAAGTEVVTDVLIFHRREPGTPPRDHTWETVTARQVDGETVHINSYFDTRPENILGDVHAGQGMHGSATLHITSHLDTVPARLRQALDGIVGDATEHGQLMAPRREVPVVDAAPRRLAAEDLWEGSIVVDGEGFATVEDGRLAPLKVAKKNAAELRRLLSLRDQVKALLELEASTLDETVEIDAARTALRDDYRSYAGRYGPINRYSYAANGARLTPEAPRRMLQDPFGPPVLALELFDDEAQTAVEAAILSGRVIAPRPLKEGTDSPAEAITLSMERHGRVQLDTVAYLLGVSESEARSRLGDLVYDDPEDPHRIVPAAEYLSGNIVERLDAARAAASADPERYQTNVNALEAVLPAPMLPEEIEPRIGAVWIDQATHQQFFRALLRNDRLNVSSPLPGTWEVTGGTKYGVLSTETWGTENKPAHELIRSLLNQTPIKVEREMDTGDRTVKVLDPEATAAALAKAEEIQERFTEWVWENPERSTRLAAEYNRRFNSIVLRNYDQAGDYLTFPGMVEG
jgi:N12 class adenine-specific DNA methylase